MLKIDQTNKRYMCYTSFWNDAHNSKMYSLGNKLFMQRQNLAYLSKINERDYFQRIDGTLEQKRRTGFLSFLQGPSNYKKKIIREMNDTYNHLKMEMTELSKEAFKDI